MTSSPAAETSSKIIPLPHPMCGEDWMSLDFVKRYPGSDQLKLWAGKPVHIQSENGIWRPGGRGYTNSTGEAWVISFEEAVETTRHCGPEKRVRYLEARAA